MMNRNIADFEALTMVDVPGSRPLGMLRAPDPTIVPQFVERVAGLANETCSRQIARYMKDGHTLEEAQEARLDFLRFMSLIFISWEQPIAPSIKADSFWHISILFTKDYAEFCDRHFGKFIHHRPGDEGVADEAFQRSTILVRRLYGVDWSARGECASCDHQPPPCDWKPGPDD